MPRRGRTGVVVVALACALSTGCAGTTVVNSPQAFPANVSTKDAAALAAAGVPWSDSRRLTWADFAGRPDPASAASAMTAYLLNYEGECADSIFRFTVRSTFLPGQAWVRTSMLLSTYHGALALQHEQTHFDLSEVQARALRADLAAIPNACDRPDDEIGAIVERHMRADAQTQRRYDRETGHGTDALAQGRWDADVREQLQARTR